MLIRLRQYIHTALPASSGGGLAFELDFCPVLECNRDSHAAENYVGLLSQLHGLE